MPYKVTFVLLKTFSQFYLGNLPMAKGLAWFNRGNAFSIRIRNDSFMKGTTYDHVKHD